VGAIAREFSCVVGMADTLLMYGDFLPTLYSIHKQFQNGPIRKLIKCTLPKQNLKKTASISRTKYINKLKIYTKKTVTYRCKPNIFNMKQIGHNLNNTRAQAPETTACRNLPNNFRISEFEYISLILPILYPV
jgi:hypothetical protein